MANAKGVGGPANSTRCTVPGPRRHFAESYTSARAVRVGELEPLAAMLKDREPWDEDWREVQDRRYDKGFYPGSGKINPFFRRLGAPDRRFGVHLLVLSIALITPPLAGWIELRFLVPLGVAALIFALGGISHIRNGARSKGG